MLARALELSMGNRKDETNPFQWDNAQINLPSTSEYDPSIPRVRLIRKDGDVASGCVIFFDDGRFYSIGKERTRPSLRCICSRLQQYDNQDATRKRHPGGKRSGAWAGICVYTDQDMPRKFLSQVKWDRLLMTLEWFANTVWRHVDPSRKLVLQYRGYLVYVDVTYPFLCPYIKSIRLSVESYRETKDKDGWEWHLNKS
jgi:hypothetical protein